jgi:hypothetical protein
MAATFPPAHTTPNQHLILTVNTEGSERAFGFSSCGSVANRRDADAALRQGLLFPTIHLLE